MSRKIYVASSWRNEYQPDVVFRLRDKGHDVYDFRNPAPDNTGFNWSQIDKYYAGWTHTEYFAALCTDIAQAGYDNDYGAMLWADTCVLVLPSGRSAHLEAGWFVGAGKSLHVYMPVYDEPDLMYKMADDIHSDLDALVAALAT